MPTTRRITTAFEKAKPASTKGVDKAQQIQSSRGIQSQPISVPEAAPSTPSPAEVDTDERALRQFDLDTKFGPVSGLSRLERWERAAKLGLKPPESVRALIAKHGESSELNRHLFAEGKV